MQQHIKFMISRCGNALRNTQRQSTLLGDIITRHSCLFPLVGVYSTVVCRVASSLWHSSQALARKAAHFMLQPSMSRHLLILVHYRNQSKIKQQLSVIHSAFFLCVVNGTTNYTNLVLLLENWWFTRRQTFIKG